MCNKNLIFAKNVIKIEKKCHRATINPHYYAKNHLFILKNCKNILILADNDSRMDIKIVSGNVEIYKVHDVERSNLSLNDLKPQTNNLGDVEVDLFEAARYLYRKFYYDGFDCSRTKIGKLLTISYLICIKQNINIFKEKILVEQCGTSIPDLADEFGDLYPNLSNNLPDRYIEDYNAYLPDDVKTVLNDVYKKFGKNACADLGNLIDTFKEEISKRDEVDNRLYIDEEKVINNFTLESLYSKNNDN